MLKTFSKKYIGRVEEMTVAINYSRFNGVLSFLLFGKRLPFIHGFLKEDLVNGEISATMYKNFKIVAEKKTNTMSQAREWMDEVYLLLVKSKKQFL